ncbi:PKD domain-containing protein, partial [candidate division WOR-3 bacterium]|nr:PKD domain-containing protein [candidate division WOR-3 bacterium]
ELASDVELRGTFFTDDNADGFYVSLIGENSIQIDSNVHYVDKTIKIKKTALDSRFKKFNDINIGITHISDDGIVNNYISPVIVDGEFVYITVDFSTVIINGMTGTTTTTLTGLSGNQSISVPNGSSYDLNITNNQPGVWTSTDGRNYTNKSIITINGSMVTTESQIPLQLFTNLEGVNDTGDIGIAYTNLTAIPREIEVVWDSDNVSLYLPYNTISGVNSQFVILWGSDNNTEPAADSTYGSEAVWSSSYKLVSLLSEVPTDSAPQFIDRTSNTNDGTAGVLDASDLIDLSYGKGIRFQGAASEYIGFGNDASLQLSQGSVIIRFKSSDAGISYRRLAVKDSVYGLYLKDNILGFYDWGGTGWNPAGTYDPTDDVEHTIVLTFNSGVSSGTKIYSDANLKLTDTMTVSAQTNPFELSRSATTENINANIGHVAILNTIIDSDYVTTTHKNLNNPTASGSDQFYLSVGETQTAAETLNITASVTGDSNEQSYNTSQSREFILTPTGTTNNILVNTASTDYNVTVTTYWTENTTLQSETATAGYAKQYINYTPSFNVISADLNTTFTFDFSAQDYIGTASSTLDDVSKTTTRVGQDVNASVGSLTEDVSYLWNVTISYNNVPTVVTITNKTAYLGISESFIAPSYSDPEGLLIDTHYWQFGDGNTSSVQNPTHTYTSIDTFSANYTVTETATVSPQAVLREFTMDVEVQPPQNVTTVPHQTNVSIDWDDYAYADKYSVYELEDGFSYVDIDPVMDGIKDVIYDYAHEFLIFSPNPVSPGDYGTIYPVRTSLGVYLLIECVDNDDKLGDDDTIYYFDLDNNGLTVDDPAWKITNNG